MHPETGNGPLELFDPRPGVNVQESEFKRLLGYPAHFLLEGRAREIAEETRRWYAENGRPWIYARQCEGLDAGNVLGGTPALPETAATSYVKINGAEFSSALLHDKFSAAQVHSAILVAVSAGPECEEKARQFWQDAKPDEYFFMEMFGSAVVENLVMLANGRLCAWAEQQGMVALPHYSPGYSGWDVSDQTRLWEIIRPRNGVSFPGQLQVMESGMLRPKKSLLAVIGLTRHKEKVRSSAHLIPCENCALPACSYRRAACLSAPPQIEEVRRLQPGATDETSEPRADAPVLDPQAKYSINFKALRKWAQERLQLKTLPDDSIEARFHYEGSTCSNMGRPLEYDYLIRLAPARHRHQILEMSCAPTPGDTGHALQCEFLRDPAAFQSVLAGEKPLLGQPLNEVVTWTRPYSPSACFCDADRRLHKWGLVFEVIHFALAQRQQEAASISAEKQTHHL